MRSLGNALCILALVLCRSTPARPCSLFTAHDQSRVLVGNNEDWYSEQVSMGNRPTLRFVPAAAGEYGYVMWGFTFAPDQGGMNDQGLFWDGLATPVHAVVSSGTEAWTDNTADQMLQRCSTVAEAVAFLEQHNLTPLRSAQLFIVDRFGDSAIFEGGQTIAPSEDYQVCTNFLQSQPELGAWPCPRYNALVSQLSSGFELSVEYFRQLAEAVHQWNGTEQLYTRYTVIGELAEGRFTLYYDLDWLRPLTLVLADELTAGPRTVAMSDLFAAVEDVDAGVADAGDGAADAATDAPHEEVGCGCAARRETGRWSWGAAWAGAWLLGLAVRRRRRHH